MRSRPLVVAQALVDLRLAMQPTCDDEQILTLVFKDDAQFKELLGFSAWPQPTEKSRLAMQKVRRPLATTLRQRPQV